MFVMDEEEAIVGVWVAVELSQAVQSGFPKETR